MKNSTDKDDWEALERLQVKKYGIVVKMGLYAGLLLLLTFAIQWRLRLSAGIFLFFVGFDAVILAEFALFLKERNKSKLSQALVSTLTKTTNGCCWIWNVATGRLHLIPKGNGILGRDVDTYADFVALIHPDDVSGFEKAVARFYASLPSSSSLSSSLPAPSGAFEIEFRAQGVHDWRWFVVRSSAVECVSDQVVRIMGSILDIDAYKRAVEAMRSSERQL